MMPRQSLKTIAYEQAKKDHNYLWETYGSACDMTGGYVDYEDLQKLLENPTKATATQCFHDQILYWFQTGPEITNIAGNPVSGPIDWLDSKVLDIAIRYNLVSQEETEDVVFLEKLFNNEINVRLRMDK